MSTRETPIPTGNVVNRPVYEYNFCVSFSPIGSGVVFPWWSSGLLVVDSSSKGNRKCSMAAFRGRLLLLLLFSRSKSTSQ